MKLVKSLLLGSTAIVAAAGAQAADLPVRKAAVVENICANLGTSFSGAWVMPGTDTCIQISGFIRGEYTIAERPDDAEYLDLAGFRARARVNFDVRTATDIGLLRGYVRLEGFSATNGAFGALGTTTLGGGLGPLFGGGVGQLATAASVVLDQGFVEIQNAAGQFIAGRSTNNFQPGFSGTRLIGFRVADHSTEQFSYTAALGQGLTLAAAVEAPLRVNSFAFVPAEPFGSTTVAVVDVTNTFGFDADGNPLVTGLNYGGQEMPDLVGRLSFQQSWGFVRLGVVGHQINDVGFPAVVDAEDPNAVPAVGASAGREAVDDEFGFAVQASAQLNLPFLNPGSIAYAYGTYADGAIAYLGYGGRNTFGAGLLGGYGLGYGAGFSGELTNAASANASTLALRGLPIADAVVVDGELQTTEGWQIGGGVEIFLTPTVRTNLYAQYNVVDFADAANVNFDVDGTTVQAGFIDFGEVIAAANVIWSPVRNLDIGVEVLYQRLEFDGDVRIATVATDGTVNTTIEDHQDAFAARFRVNRNF